MSVVWTNQEAPVAPGVAHTHLLQQIAALMHMCKS